MVVPLAGRLRPYPRQDGRVRGGHPIDRGDAVRTRVLVAVLILAVVVAVTGFSVISAGRLGTQTPPRGPLAADLAARVTQLMEHDFRGLTAAGPEPVRCTARPFGVRPDGLARAADATTVYAWVHCRAGVAGDGSRVLLAPVAVRLDRPPSVRVPEAGDERERSIRRIFPADVRDALRSTAPDDLPVNP
jgi:hypothetical protein